MIKTFLICQLYVWCVLMPSLDLGTVVVVDTAPGGGPVTREIASGYGNLHGHALGASLPATVGDYSIEGVGTYGITFNNEPSQTPWVVLEGEYTEFPSDLVIYDDLVTYHTLSWISITFDGTYTEFQAGTPSFKLIDGYVDSQDYNGLIAQIDDQGNTLISHNLSNSLGNIIVNNAN